MALFDSTSPASPAPRQNDGFPRRRGVNGRRQQFPPDLQAGLPSAAAPGLGLLRRLVALLLALTLQVLALPVAPTAALSLPWQQKAADSPVATGRGMAPLQEVSPPMAVQQLQAALGGRQPVVEIVSPQPDSVLPAGPWTLRLRVHDWPLVDGGSLGLGPHLVVQLDQEPPRIWTRSEGVMPELSPGSHRLTVYAALPWGEARKSPGAVRQIRLHRTAPNPLTLPRPGSPQLLAVSPSGSANEEPLLLDWLLLDAPLQDVGGSGTQWRLRVSINGNDVLLDQQAPLWLRGWQPGRNALRLELLDARGEALNPPFNSLVQEVNLSGTVERPRWRGERLSATELAILVGEAPAERLADEAKPTEPSSAAGDPSTLTNSGRSAEASGEARGPASAPRQASSASERSGRAVAPEATVGAGDLASPAPNSRAQPPQQQAGSAAEPGGQGPSLPLANPERQETVAANSQMHGSSAGVVQPLQSEPAPVLPNLSKEQADPVPNPETSPAAPAAASPSEQPSGAALLSDSAAAAVALASPAPANPPAPATPPAAAGNQPAPPSGSGAADASRTPPQPMTTASAEAAQASAPPAAASSGNEQQPVQPPDAPPPPSSGEDRVRPSTALTGRARDLVNDDGTLRRPERRGPLASLRERLQR